MASGNTLLILLPLAIEPLGDATLDFRNNHPVLDFDDTTNETAVWSAVMPKHYAGTTGVTVYLYWSHAAITGDVDWDAEFERIGDQVLDVDGDSFAAANSVNATTVPGTTGHVDVVNITFTDGADMDSLVAGELFRIRITRDATNDSATGDAELHAVEIRET